MTLIILSVGFCEKYVALFVRRERQRQTQRGKQTDRDKETHLCQNAQKKNRLVSLEMGNGIGKRNKLVASQIFLVTRVTSAEDQTFKLSIPPSWPVKVKNSQDLAEGNVGKFLTLFTNPGISLLLANVVHREVLDFRHQVMLHCDLEKEWEQAPCRLHSLSLSLSLSLNLSLFPCVSLPASLCLSVSLCLCLSVFVSLSLSVSHHQ